MLIQQGLKITRASPSIVLAIVAVMILTASAYMHADTTGYLDDKALITALRQGGLNIYFRHEATDWSQSDNVQKAKDWLSCVSGHPRPLFPA